MKLRALLLAAICACVWGEARAQSSMVPTQCDATIGASAATLIADGTRYRGFVLENTGAANATVKWGGAGNGMVIAPLGSWTAPLGQYTASLIAPGSQTAGSLACYVIQ